MLPSEGAATQGFGFRFRVLSCGKKGTMRGVSQGRTDSGVQWKVPQMWVGLCSAPAPLFPSGLFSLSNQDVPDPLPEYVLVVELKTYKLGNKN